MKNFANKTQKKYLVLRNGNAGDVQPLQKGILLKCVFQLTKRIGAVIWSIGFLIVQNFDALEQTIRYLNLRSHHHVHQFAEQSDKQGILYQFSNELEWNSKEYPECVKWITSSARKSKLIRPIILTEDEIKRMFKVADRGREKAMISFMYESGCRCPDELLHMKVSDVEFDEYGAKVKLTSGKVGSRTIRIIASVPSLKVWINEEHPDPRLDNWLWVSKSDRNRNQPINYQSLKLAVRRWRHSAGIEKKVTSYTFRRTRYTHLATKMPTPLLYKYMGQVQGSKVIDRYVELNDEAVDGAILNFYNMTKPETNDKIKPLFCSRCNKQNSPELEYCDICHAPLTEKALIEVESKKKVEMRALFDELKKEFKEEMGKI